MTIVTQKWQDVNEFAVTEEMSRINETKILKNVEVTITYKDQSGFILKNEQFLISGDNYDLLMTENPDFAPGKPANEYREADLWHVIDLLRNEQ
ncbi:hypothetical protein A8709_33030 [Paenibacillus pectinilyticus]|uniref:Uncharacterized protein n=2 Tax=Paenibacillus pectinilyticus TaxID=512399 RepID=A0A1C0ZX13_9BACL|nr:hypothetical protein A8709_33030 [Paenibacillus pectinilyticus]